VRWGFAAGELALAPDLALALEAARSFDAWEVTLEGPWATMEGLAPVRAALPSFPFAVTVHGAFRRVDLAAASESVRAAHVGRLLEQLEAARALGATAMVVHPGARIRGVPPQGAVERSAASLRTLAARGRDLGVEVRVENMPAGPLELAQAPAEQAVLAQAAGAACWDAGHGHTLGDPPLDSIAPWVREVHLHDNRGTNDDHRPVGENSAWVPGVLRALASPSLLVVAEHRTLAECLATRTAAEALLRRWDGR
jgi:sugar phosphate isomerase/epimerase